MTSPLTLCPSSLLATQVPLTFLGLNPISIWWVAGGAIFRGKCIRVQQASHWEQVINRAPCRAEDKLHHCVTVASSNFCSYDYSLVETFLAVFALFWGWYQATQFALQMLLVQVWLQRHLIVVQLLPECFNKWCRTPNHVHGSSWLCSLIPVVSIGHAPCISAETSHCAAEPFWRLCPSPSRVCYLPPTCPTLYPHYRLHSHPPHCQNLQNQSDCLW